ncbi:MAG: hypothetical protein HFE51_04970 [Clostridia bacterium]|nr:hypothetical protein [Clostridia bacterium]
MNKLKHWLISIVNASRLRLGITREEALNVGNALYRAFQERTKLNKDL